MSEIVSSADFQSKVLDCDQPVLVDFFATWCGPCKMIAPTLEEVAAEVEGRAKVCKVDIDQSRDIAARYGVMSVPTLIVFEGGQPARQVVGVQSKQALLSLLG
ncbi:thioredoxin [Eggerthellaceae bacterium zg-887]|uniref:thioredoxin n=1 Tax=Xiamenia xianingshaonis TaxID=2682776 RepID=UPI00140C556C|nr:thioredoxin [Xiamenia xianingshaonis]NHM15555.1 thioredoxin [Xiamenia xianingshaonis]